MEEPSRANRSVPKGQPTDSRTLDHPGKPVGSECAHCKQRIVVHCHDCGVQISGCACSFGERLDEVMEQVKSTRGLFIPGIGN